MQNSTSSLPFCAHSPKNTARPKSMRNVILSRFCISNTVLRAFVAVLQRDKGRFEYVASRLVGLQHCHFSMSRPLKYRNILANVSLCCSGSTVSSRRLLPLLLTMLICLLTGSPRSQSSPCRHEIRASDLVGCYEYAGDVAPAEERSRSSQSHTCKNQPPDCTHLPLNPSAFPLSTHNSGRMQAYSEVVKRRPEAWKTALPSLISILPPSLTSHLQHAQSGQAPQTWLAVCQRHTGYCRGIFRAPEGERSVAPGARRRAAFLVSQSLPKREGPP